MSAVKEIISKEELRHFLWKDTKNFENRFRKSAIALAAIHKFIVEHSPLDGVPEEIEFLALYDQISQMPDESFSIVWQDPLAYAWSVTVFDMLPSLDMLRLRYREKKNPEWRTKAELVKHQVTEQLEYFKAFALAIALISKKDLIFVKPFRVELPFSIPGTSHLLYGELYTDILELNKSVLKVNKDGEIINLDFNKGVSKELSPVRLVNSPVINAHGTNFRIDCYAARFPHFNFEEGMVAAAAPQTIGPEQINVIEQAVLNFKLFYPEGFDQFCRWLRVTLTKSPWSAGFDASATTNLPGLMSHRMGNNAVWLSEIFVHEFFHNRLFFLDEERPLLDFNPGPEKYYHSWRLDARPPLGAIHATYVFIPVTKFFLRLCGSDEFTGIDAEYITDFTARTSMKLLQAVDSIIQIEELTDHGKAFVETLVSDVEELAFEVAKYKITLDGPALKFSPRKNEFERMESLSHGELMTS